MNKNETFSIRQMIELTGLSEFTIRGWENRYEAFDPARTDTGRREYSKKDVERALLLRELLKRGQKISKIAKLNNSQLLVLFEKTEVIRHQHLNEDAGKRNLKPQDTQLATKAVELMALQKWSELANLFRSVEVQQASLMIKEFFLPVISELALQINAGTVSIAQEHVICSLIKEKIYSVISQVKIKSAKNKKLSLKKLRFVLATPEGDYHEIGLLLAHLLIRSYQMTSLYIGPHTPPQELAETALRFEASHLLVVSTVSKKAGARLDTLSYVSELQKKMGPQLQIILSGGQAPHLPIDKTASLITIHSFSDLDHYLQTLGGF